jgi:hypothetical protein
MRRLLPALCVAALALAGSASAQPTAFRTADGGAGCRVLPAGAVACRSVQPGPALVLPRTGAPRTSAHRVAWTGSTPVLRAGASWRLGGTACAVRDRAITCTNRSGGFVVVSRRGLAAAPPPALHR